MQLFDFGEVERLPYYTRVSSAKRGSSGSEGQPYES